MIEYRDDAETGVAEIVVGVLLYAAVALVEKLVVRWDVSQKL